MLGLGLEHGVGSELVGLEPEMGLSLGLKLHLGWGWGWG